MPRNRDLTPLASVLVVAASALLAIGAMPAAGGAQRVDDTRGGVAVPRDTGQAATPLFIDNAPPLTPTRAFLWSLFVPGSAQLRLRRPGAGALFALAEAAGVVMAAKSARELSLAKRLRTDSIIERYEYRGRTADQQRDSIVPIYVEGPVSDSLVRSRRTHLEDWVAFLVFNHLLAGTEAYISAHLWDLPTDISVEPRRRRTALVARIRFR